MSPVNQTFPTAENEPSEPDVHEADEAGQGHPQLHRGREQRVLTLNPISENLNPRP